MLTDKSISPKFITLAQFLPESQTTFMSSNFWFKLEITESGYSHVLCIGWL